MKAEVGEDVYAALVMVRDQKLTDKTTEQLILEEADRIRSERNGKHNHQDNGSVAQ